MLDVRHAEVNRPKENTLLLAVVLMLAAVFVTPFPQTIRSVLFAVSGFPDENGLHASLWNVLPYLLAIAVAWPLSCAMQRPLQPSIVERSLASMVIGLVLLFLLVVAAALIVPFPQIVRLLLLAAAGVPRGTGLYASLWGVLPYLLGFVVVWSLSRAMPRPLRIGAVERRLLMAAIGLMLPFLLLMAFAGTIKSDGLGALASKTEPLLALPGVALALPIVGFIALRNLRKSSFFIKFSFAAVLVVMTLSAQDTFLSVSHYVQADRSREIMLDMIFSATNPGRSFN